jgi:polyisoprenoid-binding protein YceI
MSTVTSKQSTMPATGTYAIDASHSQVGFKVRHLMVSKVRGDFAEFGGTVTIEDDPLQSHVEVEVDLASIDTRDATRDGHLRSADFFDVEKHPKMTFRSTAVREVGDDRYDVDGELALLGVTRPLTLHATYEGAATDPWGKDRLAFSARGKVNREEFGLTWNQALESGGFLVGKDLDIEIEVEVVKES